MIRSRSYRNRWQEPGNVVVEDLLWQAAQLDAGAEFGINSSGVFTAATYASLEDITLMMKMEQHSNLI